MTKGEAWKRIIEGNFNNEYGFDLQILVDCMGLVSTAIKNGEIIPTQVADGDRAVSLNAVLDALEVLYLKSEIDELTYQRIKQLPSVTPQRPKGHWIMKHRNINKIEYHTGEDVLTDEIHTVKELIRYETDEPYCSECGKRADDIAQDFCGYCGVRIREDGDMVD